MSVPPGYPYRCRSYRYTGSVDSTSIRAVGHRYVSTWYSEVTSLCISERSTSVCSVCLFIHRYILVSGHTCPRVSVFGVDVCIECVSLYSCVKIKGYSVHVSGHIRVFTSLVLHRKYRPKCVFCVQDCLGTRVSPRLE